MHEIVRHLPGEFECLLKFLRNSQKFPYAIRSHVWSDWWFRHRTLSLFSVARQGYHRREVDTPAEG